MGADPTPNEGHRSDIWRAVGLTLAALAIGGGLTWCGTTLWLNFATFGCRARQAEPRSALIDVQRAQRIFHTRTGTYAVSLDALRIEHREGARYRLALVPSASKIASTTFTAEAVSTDPAFDDRWTIGPEGKPINRINGCLR